MTYLSDESQVLYRSKDGKNERTFDALDWLAAMPACACRTQTGVPMFPTRENKWFDTMATTATSVGVNGRRQMRTDWCLPSCSPMNHPRGTARTGQGLPASGGLIQKIYEIDPLTCPKCHGPMAVIAFIEAEDVIEKILKHLGLWELTPRPVCVHRTGRPPPRSAKSQPLSTEPHIDYSHRGVGPYGPEADSQLAPSNNELYVDREYPADSPA
jgi:hypothetical protein